MWKGRIQIMRASLSDTRRLLSSGSVYVRVFSSLAASLAFLIDESGRTTLGHEENDCLRDSSEDESFIVFLLVLLIPKLQ
jgi:hypothetical protein